MHAKKHFAILSLAKEFLFNKVLKKIHLRVYVSLQLLYSISQSPRLVM